MRFAIPCLAFSAAGAVALPFGSDFDFGSAFSRDKGGAPKCMTSKEATAAVEIYRQLIAEYTPELGAKWVAESFVDNSDSINTIVHQPLGGPTFPNKAAFLANQLVVPKFPVSILNIDATKCNTVTFQWKATFGAANLPSKGMTVLQTVWEDSLWKIRQIDVEFNSLIWLLNMGGSYTLPDGKTYTPASPDPALAPK